MAQSQSDASEFGHGAEGRAKFVIPRCYAPEIFEFVEESLDQVALLVEPWREGEALLAVGSIGNIGPDVPGRSGFTDGVAVIPLGSDTRRKRVDVG